MPTFTAPDGTALAFHVMGEGEPLFCLPGGPMRASAYLGDLGGLSKQRQLVMLDLRGTGDSGIPVDPATYRCDRQVLDVEALRRHLGLDRVDVLAHSAAGDLALLYAARYPERIRTLSLITARARALGVDFTVEHRLEAAALRTAEPWFGSARDAFEAIWAGTATDAEFDAATPFFYGRWDAAAQAHAALEVEQCNEEAAEIYASSGAFEPAATRAAIAALRAPVLVLAGELDGGPRPRIAAAAAQLFPQAELTVQPGSGHYPWLDDPEHFTRTVDTFLRQSVADES
ncbi:alpha/beta fold hydrolase [Streptomyces inhibens]|uniref:alpha/beta fold hydrolase n=1 Tax=Streptomyces inhibens TaxID=2293571 RepID=UPI001EE768A1|nr:alpha/beta hydrolase [Streptomyces inhibens]UKY48332.1 alpha/beta hydrolase [Streptomyces inhibens]